MSLNGWCWCLNDCVFYQVNITRDGCGVSKLCVETPNDCDPAANGTCLFASLTASTPVAPNGTVLSVELRGESMGYIALGLTQNASEVTNATIQTSSCSVEQTTVPVLKYTVYCPKANDLTNKGALFRRKLKPDWTSSSSPKRDGPESQRSAVMLR